MNECTTGACMQNGLRTPPYNLPLPAPFLRHSLTPFLSVHKELIALVGPDVAVILVVAAVPITVLTLDACSA